MIKGFLAGLFFIICGMVIYLSFHLGFFKPVEIKQEIRGPFHIIYQEHRGAYYQVSEVINQIEQKVRQSGMPCEQTFGEFFDNPKEVDEDRLRSRGGCLSENPYPHSTDGLETDLLPEQRYVVAKFTGSPAIGPWRVYPKVQEYLDKNRLHATEEAIEIYTLKNNTIETEYLFPLK